MTEDELKRRMKKLADDAASDFLVLAERRVAEQAARIRELEAENATAASITDHDAGDEHR